MRKSLEDITNMLVFGKIYKNLPEELDDFYYYFKDAGSVIMCVPNQFKPEAEKIGNFDDFEVGVPVKYVLSHPYTIKDGYLFIDVPYDDCLGININDNYYEY